MGTGNWIHDCGDQLDGDGLEFIQKLLGPKCEHNKCVELSICRSCNKLRKTDKEPKPCRHMPRTRVELISDDTTRRCNRCDTSLVPIPVPQKTETLGNPLQDLKSPVESLTTDSNVSCYHGYTAFPTRTTRLADPDDEKTDTAEPLSPEEPHVDQETDTPTPAASVLTPTPSGSL